MPIKLYNTTILEQTTCALINYKSGKTSNPSSLPSYRLISNTAVLARLATSWSLLLETNLGFTTETVN